MTRRTMRGSVDQVTTAFNGGRVMRCSNGIIACMLRHGRARDQKNTEDQCERSRTDQPHRSSLLTKSQERHWAMPAGGERALFGQRSSASVNGLFRRWVCA
jgi:hypothetical protein